MFVSKTARLSPEVMAGRGSKFQLKLGFQSETSWAKTVMVNQLRKTLSTIRLNNHV